MFMDLFPDIYDDTSHDNVLYSQCILCKPYSESGYTTMTIWLRTDYVTQYGHIILDNEEWLILKYGEPNKYCDINHNQNHHYNYI